MPLFVRVTIVVALALAVLMLLAFVLKLLIVAAIVAALVVAGVWVVRLFSRRRSQQLVVTNRWDV